jgi:hypothetical protein
MEVEYPYISYFREFYFELREALSQLAAKQFRSLKRAAVYDAEDFLASSKCQLEDYFRLLELKVLTLDEHDFLMAALKENADMDRLRWAGRPIEAIDKLIDDMVKLTMEMIAAYAVKYIFTK